MLCHLPYPYEDELLYSVIARYLVRVGAKSPVSTIDLVFGHRVVATVDLPGSLDTVSERTWLIWRMPGEEIAERLTLFPYYSRYLPSVKVGNYLKKLLSAERRFNHMGIRSYSQGNVPKFLRFCPTCRESDLTKYAETYWRRSHQLPGVLVCPEHKRPLLDSRARMRPTSHRCDFVDATVSTVYVSSDREARLSEGEMAMAIEIARRSQEMLLRPIKPWDTEQTRMSYRQAALERGFAKGNNLLLQPELKSAFVLFYGESILSALNCSVEPNCEGHSWLERIFSSCQYRSFHPLKHTLIQIFLETIPVKPSKRVRLVSHHWKCPNPYAKHEEPFPIKSPNKIYHGMNNEIVASVRCKCGFQFTFTRTTDADPYLPVVNKIVAHGPFWATEAKRLKNNGLGICAITVEMGIGFKTAKRLLSEEQTTNYVSQEMIDQWREEWSSLLEKVPNRSRSIAAKKNAPLYARLWKYDREWLQREPKLRTYIPPSQKRVNWASRDIEWSQMLRSTASRILEEIPAKRASRAAIIREAGLSICTFSTKKQELPICQSVLKELSESADDFRERRLRMAATNMITMGMHFTPSMLLRNAGILNKYLSPRLNAVFRELFSGINSLTYDEE